MTELHRLKGVLFLVFPGLSIPSATFSLVNFLIVFLPLFFFNYCISLILKYYYQNFSNFRLRIIVTQMVKNLPIIQETWIQFPEKGMATQAVIAWEILSTEEPRGLPSMVSQIWT